jgi:glyceraldehyde-3-phosphate dehydrogenase (NADP+)
MNAIPEEFQIKTLLNQDTYLVDGELKNGRSNISGVLNDFIKRKYEPTILGSIHLWGERRRRQSMPLTRRLIMVREYGPP